MHWSLNGIAETEIISSNSTSFYELGAKHPAEEDEFLLVDASTNKEVPVQKDLRVS